MEQLELFEIISRRQCSCAAITFGGVSLCQISRHQCEYIFLKGDPLNKILTNVSFFLSKVGGVSVHPICRFLSLLPSILPGVSLLLKRFPKIELVTISVFSEITCWLLRGAYKGSGLQ